MTYEHVWFGTSATEEKTNGPQKSLKGPNGPQLFARARRGAEGPELLLTSKFQIWEGKH